MNDANDLRLRSSMRSRMSRSYIDELRGVGFQGRISQLDMNNNNDSNRSSHSSIQMNSFSPLKTNSITFPASKMQQKIVCSSCHSTLSLGEIQLKSIDENQEACMEKSRPSLLSPPKTVILSPKDLECLTVEDVEKLDEEKDVIVHRASISKLTNNLKPAIKNNNRLTVPSVGDFCIRIPDRLSTITDEQQQLDMNETRLSDALGYLRMYKNQNRIQFNSLQCNDREDLQVISIDRESMNPSSLSHKVLIDGPYGAPSQHIFEADHAVLIAAGIGITPFASILQSIMCRYRNRRHKCPNCDYIWDNQETEELSVKKVNQSMFICFPPIFISFINLI